MSEGKNINLVLTHAEDNEKPLLTLRGIIEQIKRVFLIWIVLAIIAGVVSGSATLLMKSSNMSVQAIIEFTFDGVEEGKDPKGNEFDPTKIKSPAVLDDALNALEMDIPVDILRKNIKVRSIMPEEKYQELTGYKSLFESGGSSSLSAVKAMLGVSYHPTRFQIVLDLDQADIEEEQGVAVMNAILDSYKRYFYETYGYNKALGSAVLSVDYKEYDYERVIEVFDTTLNSAQKYVNSLSSEGGTNFRSVKTGYSFSDLVSALETIRSEDLDWISSYISVNNVTKDKEQLLTYYEYRIQSLQRTMTAAEKNLASIQESITSYQKDPILVMSGGSDSGSVTVGQSSKQYDDMIKKKLAVQDEIAQCEKDISYFEYRVAKLQETSNVTSKAQMEVLDKRLDSLYEKISALLNTVNETADEFYENVAYANACTVILPATVSVSSHGANMLNTIIMVEAVLFAAFALLILCRAFAEQYRKNNGIVKPVSVAADASKKDEEAASDEELAEAKSTQKKNRK